MVQAEPRLIEEIFKTFKELVVNHKIAKYIRHEIIVSLAKIIKLLRLNSICYQQVNELLEIIYLDKTQNFYDDYLHTDATLTLHKITNHITQEYEKRKNPKVIEWFNGCFKELPNIAETRIFLKEICKAILKSGAINQLESQFILNCVKNYHFTFTVAINKDNREIAGEIIFEDRHYEIFQNDTRHLSKLTYREEFKGDTERRTGACLNVREDSSLGSTYKLPLEVEYRKMSNLEEFAAMLLAATDDPLAEQYKTHKPLFLNNGLGLKIERRVILWT